MVLLGFAVVKTLVLTTSVLDMMSQSIAGLWEHSLACARTCGIIAKHLDMPDPEEISVTGLLHDLGKVVLQQNLKGEFGEVVDLVRQNDVLFYEAENQVMGVTHAGIGGWLLEKWQLPAQIVEPIAHHHTFHPVRSNADRTAVVHIADILVRAEGFGFGGDRKVPVISPEALEFLKLSVEDLREVMDAMNDQLSDVIRL
jgi:putative nucleotidyltransferase with HDIG domain